MKYIISIDEGTTSTRSCLYNIDTKKIEKISQRPIAQYYPVPGYVEEDAEEIYQKTLDALKDNIVFAGKDNVLGIGITNQRETVVAWDKTTGKPIYNAIVWQCRRTSRFCDELKKTKEKEIHKKTGLVIDAYFSASKIKWLIDNVPEVRKELDNKNLCVGTIDTYLIYRLTGGKSFVTDYTNASRTMLFNINTLTWDKELLNLFEIPIAILPKVIRSTDVAGAFEYDGKNIAIAGIAGDQQAALFGQGCFDEGSSKITYGTGMFMLYNIGSTPALSKNGLITTIGYCVGDKICYAFEGSVFNAGSSVQWLRDELAFFNDSSESEKWAQSVPNSGGVYVVPAFTGLGAPYWDSNAKGIITGITRGTTKAHIIRATLEAIAYSAKDLAVVMERDSQIPLKETRCDGGASANNFLMQFQADTLGVWINRPVEKESTSLGAIYLCGIAIGLFKMEDIEQLRSVDRLFKPTDDREICYKRYDGWKKAIKQCRNLE